MVNATAAINNLSYYRVESSGIRRGRLHLAAREARGASGQRGAPQGVAVSSSAGMRIFWFLVQISNSLTGV